MGAGHGHKLHFHGHSPVHRAPAHLKIVALVAFMLIVVATPREWYAAFAVYLAVLLVVIAVSRVPVGYLARRMVVEVPFVVFAALMPFVATGPQVEVLGVSVSEAGLLGAWGLLVKGTLGVLASLTLAATTEPSELLRGLERLRMPAADRADHGFHDPLPRRRHRRDGPDDRGDALARLRPAVAAALARDGPLAGRAVRPLLRARRARAPRDAVARAPMTTPVLDVRGLAYAYPDGHQALFGVDLHVHAGERVALLGPNGAGKTTLVLHLNGILTAGAGTVAVSGLPVAKEHLQEIRRRVGIVFQDPDDQLFLGSVRQDVAFGPANMGLRGAALETRVMESLERVGMAAFADRPPHHLSFGQRRRVAVATVLAMEPEILVLDEPSSNLDPASRRELADILRSLDVTVLMVTHDLPYALELCPRSVVLSDGAVVADGATYDVLTDDALMRAHRLELPFGFDPRTIGSLPA